MHLSEYFGRTVFRWFPPQTPLIKDYVSIKLVQARNKVLSHTTWTPALLHLLLLFLIIYTTHVIQIKLNSCLHIFLSGL